MRRALRGAMGLLVGVCWALSQPAGGQETSAPEAEPQELEELAPAGGGLREGPFTVAEHWTPYTPPSEIPEGAKVHIVERGDTLWDIAATYLDDPFLWPQLWEANGYITNANLIYPGDPIIIPELQVVTEEAIEEELEAPPAITEFEPRPQPPLPYALDADVWCASFLQQPEDHPIEIIGAEYEHVGQGTRDVVYINRGDADGVLPGDEFFVIRRGQAVHHPHSDDYLGHYHQFIGRLKLVVTQEHTSTAQITFACDAIERGDRLKPFADFVRPVKDVEPLTDRFATPSGKLGGTIVVTNDNFLSVGAGDMVVVDVGTSDGVLPGDLFTIYSEQRGIHGEELPRHNKGVLAILIPFENSSVAKITHSVDEIQVGHDIEQQ